MGQGLQQFFDGDSASGVLDRKTFIDLAVMELGAFFTQDIPCCLAVMKLNDFEDFNEQYGRAVADAVLRRVARILSGYLRKTDIMGCYDGARFIVFFADVDQEDCRGICDRLVRNLAVTPLVLEAGLVHITASFGVAGAGWGRLREPLESREFIERLAERAERELVRPLA
jgi:diguanylate cyclase (GGDEF)-like protein